MVIYRAKDGDTVASIARRHSMLPNRLCELNGWEADSPPIPEQDFVIDNPCKSYYVKPEDTLRSIAARHHIPLSALKRMNPALRGGEEIYPGMTLTLENAEPHNKSLVRKHYSALRREIAASFSELCDNLSKVNEQ